MKKIIILFLFCTGAIFANEYVVNENKKFNKIVKKYIQADSLECWQNGDKRIAKYYKGAETGYFIISSDYVKLKGYQGITTLGIEFISNGEIHRVQLISSQDTRSFVRKLNRSWFWQQFAKDESVEFKTVTGATITSNAIVKSVKIIKREIQEVIENIENK
jgi:uncharacterized protein with FMN-binding domain